MRASMLLLPLAVLVACTGDDKGDDVVEPDPNYELPAEIDALYADLGWTVSDVEANTTDVDCADDVWSVSAYTAGEAAEVWGFAWDLSTTGMGEAVQLTEDSPGSWSAELSAEEVGHTCADGDIAYVFLPVDAEGLPGIAEIDERFAGVNAISSTGFSLSNDEGSVSLTTAEEVDTVTAHVVNPYASFYWGPVALDADGPTSYSIDINVNTDLGTTSFDAVWISYAALTDGQLVGIAGG